MKEKQKDEGCGGFWLIKDHYYDKTYSVTSHYYIFTSAIEARMQPKRTKWGPFKFLFCQFFGCKVTQTNHKAMTMFNWMFLMFQNSLNQKNECTVRPRGTRPHGTRTSLGHDFKKGSKILAGHDFGTWTSRDTILKSI